MSESPELDPRPPDVDIRMLTLVVGLVVAVVVTWAAYRDPQFGDAAAVGLAALVPPNTGASQPPTKD